MNIQEREELDYQMGCASELQNACSRSRMEVQLQDDTKKICDLVSQGKHVVAVSYPSLCPSTDAYLGTNVCFQAAFDTREEALDKFFELTNCGYGEGDCDVWVEPITQPALQPFDWLEDDSPF